MDEFGDNIWADPLDEIGTGLRGRRLRRTAGSELVAAVWELDPGAASGPYHLHHGTEEYLIVLRGRPTLRTPEGEQELAEGEVVHFPRGREGAHQLLNQSDAPVRYVMAAVHGSPEIIEYPDKGMLIAGARTESEGGERLFTAHRFEDAIDPDERSE